MDYPTPALTVIGSINQDITATTERLPGPGETVMPGVLTTRPGGKGANQAAAAARLGATTRMIGAVGDDASGVTMLEALRTAGVATDDIRVLPGVQTGTALVIVDAAGENQIVVCPGANDEVSLDGVAFDDGPVLCQLEVDVELIAAASRATTGFFALNAAPALALPAELIERCDLIIVNETEYQLIPALAEARRVVVTLGGDGAEIRSHGERVAFAPAIKTTVVDSVGAGDAFCAALVLALASGRSDEESLRIACAVGADAVGQAASQPEFRSLDQY